MSNLDRKKIRRIHKKTWSIILVIIFLVCFGLIAQIRGKRYSMLTISGPLEAAGAIVYVNNSERGKMKPDILKAKTWCYLSLPPGDYVVVIRKEGHRKYAENVQIEEPGFEEYINISSGNF